MSATRPFEELCHDPRDAERVHRHTADHVNREIRDVTEENVARYAQGGPAAIEQRLPSWTGNGHRTDVGSQRRDGFADRLALGATVDRKWFAFPAVVASFLLQHALQGWCPPLPIFRRMGFRTAAEIDRERYALKALRGDFRNVSGNGMDQLSARQALAAAER